MMKVSHPIVFGHAVKTYYKDAFNKHGAFFDELGINVNNGMVDLYDKISKLPASTREEIERDLHACQVHRPRLAMVDSSKGITNFHSPSDIIVDASMPAMIRNGGKMWGADGKPYDCKAVMPESTFARIYQEMINFCKWHGNFDPTTMGTVPNVGLMAQKRKNMARMTRLLKRVIMVLPVLLTKKQMKSCLNSVLRRAISGECVKLKMSLSKIGSSLRYAAHANLIRQSSFG
jgi:monomeric type NADP-dependent isocitrate dehydrogenase